MMTLLILTEHVDSNDVSSGAQFCCHVLFQKSSHNHGQWNFDANSSLKELHGGIDLFLLRGSILWHVGNGPYIVLQQL
jgi:hypothetical protein